MSSSFTNPFMYWIGSNLGGMTDGEHDEFTHFYSDVHMPEVVAGNPAFAFGHCYELAVPDPRGNPGPEFLAVYGMSDEQAVSTYLARYDAPPGTPGLERPTYSERPSFIQDRWDAVWRIMWRRISDTGDRGVEPHSITILGVDPPSGASARDIEEFNDFYTNVHVPETMAAWGFLRATRHELYRDLLHPLPGCPMFVAIWEADEATTIALREGAARPTPSQGPDVWQRHVTSWRLQYERF
jgi:hypothetical protein